MRPSHRRLLAALLPLAGACALHHTSSSFPVDSATRAAADTPARFTSATPPGDGACVSPLTDPRGGAPLRLVRSAGGRGDYEASGRYGARGDELLRVECATGRAVGLVPR